MKIALSENVSRRFTVGIRNKIRFLKTSTPQINVCEAKNKEAFCCGSLNKTSETNLRFSLIKLIGRKFVGLKKAFVDAPARLS